MVITDKIFMFCFALCALLVTDCGANVVKFKSNQVDPAKWSANSTEKAESVANCGIRCRSDAACLAFSYDGGTGDCELGPMPNLPADAMDPGGKDVFAFVGDQCGATAFSQGYTVSINSKHFMVEGTATYTKPEARAACQAKGGDLAIFKTAEEFLAVKPIMPPTSVALWLGFDVNPAVASSQECDTDSDPASACDGVFLWDDGTAAHWTDQDMTDWTIDRVWRGPGFGESCGAWKYGRMEDAPCDSWYEGYAACYIDCN